MIAAAYRYADGRGEMPDELMLLSYAERFGAEMVFGRLPTFKELRRMILAENVVSAYKSRAASDNWVFWSQENPEQDALLVLAMKMEEKYHG